MSQWAARPLYPVLSVAALLVLVGTLVLRSRRPRPEVHPEPLPCVPASDTWAADLRAEGDMLDIGAPLPRKPMPGQKRPPCAPRAEVEANGACWIPHAEHPPCPDETYEYDGRCLVPMAARKPTPVSGPAP